MALVRRPAARRSGLLTLPAAAAAALVLVLAACGGSGYDYVTNSDKGLYFKVPDDWATIKVNADDRPDALAPERPWITVIDKSPQPSAGHAEEDVPEHPVGAAVIEPVDSRRDQVSIAFLRSLALGGQADPLTLIQEGSSDIELVKYKELATDDGFRGARIAFTLRLGEEEYVTIDQVALVNNDTSRLYRLTLRCEADCYRLNQQEIDDIVESWTVKERT